VTHWLIRYDPDDGEPHGEVCACEIGEDHDGTGEPNGLDEDGSRAAAARAKDAAQQRAGLHELVVAALSDAMDHHDEVAASLCACGYREPYGIGIGMHQLEAAATAVLDLPALRLTE